MAALKVAGSQLSTKAILGSLLLTWAVATFDQVTHKLTNTASALTKIANFRMTLSSSFLAKDFLHLGMWLWMRHRTRRRIRIGWLSRHGACIFVIATACKKRACAREQHS